MAQVTYKQPFEFIAMLVPFPGAANDSYTGKSDANGDIHAQCVQFADVSFPTYAALVNWLGTPAGNTILHVLQLLNLAETTYSVNFGPKPAFMP